MRAYAKGAFTNYVVKWYWKCQMYADFSLFAGIPSQISTRGGQLFNNGQNLVNVVVERQLMLMLSPTYKSYLFERNTVDQAVKDEPKIDTKLYNRFCKYLDNCGIQLTIQEITSLLSFVKQGPLTGFANAMHRSFCSCQFHGFVFISA